MSDDDPPERVAFLDEAAGAELLSDGQTVAEFYDRSGDDVETGRVRIIDETGSLGIPEPSEEEVEAATRDAIESGREQVSAVERETPPQPEQEQNDEDKAEQSFRRRVLGGLAGALSWMYLSAAFLLAPTDPLVSTVAVGFAPTTLNLVLVSLFWLVVAYFATPELPGPGIHDVLPEDWTPIRCRVIGHDIPIEGDRERAGMVQLERVECARCGEVMERAV